MEGQQREITKMKPVTRVVSLFVSPKALMENIREYPAVLVPLIICALLAFAGLPLTNKLVDIQQRTFSNISIERYGVDYFNYTPFDEDGDLAQTISAVTQITTVAMLLISYPLNAFFSALGLFIITKIARGTCKLGQYFSMYTHVFIISALGGLLASFLMVTFDTILDSTSLAAVFMPLGDQSMPVFNILSSVTVFNVWITALTVIGVKAVNGFSTVRASVVCITGFVISVAIAVASLSATFIMYDFMSKV